MDASSPLEMYRVSLLSETSQYGSNIDIGPAFSISMAVRLKDCIVFLGATVKLNFGSRNSISVSNRKKRRLNLVFMTRQNTISISLIKKIFMTLISLDHSSKPGFESYQTRSSRPRYRKNWLSSTKTRKRHLRN